MLGRTFSALSATLSEAKGAMSGGFNTDSLLALNAAFSTQKKRNTQYKASLEDRMDTQSELSIKMSEVSGANGSACLSPPVRLRISAGTLGQRVANTPTAGFIRNAAWSRRRSPSAAANDDSPPRALYIRRE